MHDPEATCAEDDADDDITDKEGDLVEVEADAELLVIAARFIVCTGCVQTGCCDSVVCEKVLESTSTLELPAVDVEANAEACEEDAVVGSGRPEWPGKGGNILTPANANRLGRCNFPWNPDLFLNGCPGDGEMFLDAPLSPRRFWVPFGVHRGEVSAPPNDAADEEAQALLVATPPTVCVSEDAAEVEA